jgi:flagellar biosynthesis GTPase FlhF
MNEVKTFTGRSLDEILPQVRAELGADAVVVRRREGLSGGVAGFFQRPFAEVHARAPLPDERRLGEDGTLRNDRATAEGLATTGIQTLVEQASPFADALMRAEATVGERAHEVMLAAAQSAATPAPAAVLAPPAPAGLYGPQPRFDAVTPNDAGELVAPFDPASDEAGVVAGETQYPELESPERLPVRISAAPAAPASAARAIKTLETTGLSASLAADVVGEAVAHGLPFAQPRGLKKLVQTALARRMTVMADLGDGARTLAFVGGGGAGKSAAIAHLAAAYASADAEVVVVALRTPDGGCRMAADLEPLGISVIAAADAGQALRRLARRDPLLTLVDTPATGPGDRAAVATLAAELRTLRVEEVHLTVPATLSAAAGDELAAALAPLGVTHVALTHVDQTARPGAAVELAITGRRALSYVATREGIEPADPADIARRLLP